MTLCAWGDGRISRKMTNSSFQRVQHISAADHVHVVCPDGKEGDTLLYIRRRIDTDSSRRPHNSVSIVYSSYSTPFGMGLEAGVDDIWVFRLNSGIQYYSSSNGSKPPSQRIPPSACHRELVHGHNMLHWVVVRHAVGDCLSFFREIAVQKSSVKLSFPVALGKEITTAKMKKKGTAITPVHE